MAQTEYVRLSSAAVKTWTVSGLAALILTLVLAIIIAYPAGRGCAFFVSLAFLLLAEFLFFAQPWLAWRKDASTDQAQIRQSKFLLAGLYLLAVILITLLNWLGLSASSLLLLNCLALAGLGMGLFLAKTWGGHAEAVSRKKREGQAWFDLYQEKLGRLADQIGVLQPELSGELGDPLAALLDDLAYSCKQSPAYCLEQNDQMDALLAEAEFELELLLTAIQREEPSESPEYQGPREKLLRSLEEIKKTLAQREETIKEARFENAP